MSETEKLRVSSRRMITSLPAQPVSESQLVQTHKALYVQPQVTRKWCPPQHWLFSWYLSKAKRIAVFQDNLMMGTEVVFQYTWVDFSPYDS